MNNLKSKLSRARSLISIKTYKRPLVFIILTMLMINIMILIVAALIALAIDDSFTGFIDAFANGSMKWLLSPNAILAITNPRTLFLAVVVLITGMILFTGTIIALTTNAIKDYFHKKQSGSGKIYLERHIAILNWNNKVPELVADLIHVEHRKITVMILSDIDKEYAEKQIVNAIQKLNKADRELTHFNVLVKHGDPLLRGDLDDISISEADAIIVMNKDMHEEVAKKMSKSDLNVIKVILSLGGIDFVHNPPIVAEIKNYETKDKILTLEKTVHTLKEHVLIPVCFDKRLGQIIAQTIINPLMEDVYLSLFSFQGAEVYHLPGISFSSSLEKGMYAFPIAQSEEGVFVLSSSHDLIDKVADTISEFKKVHAKPIDETTMMDVYIIGKNNKLGFILESFKAYEQLHKSEFCSQWVALDQVDEMIDKVNALKKPATIVLLSDDTASQDSLDATVIDTLIYLQGHLERQDVNVIVELLDPRNDHIVKDFKIQNTIISNKIISLLLSKLALFSDTAAFYENLLTIAPGESGEDDQAIIIRKAESLFKDKLPLDFASKKELIRSVYEAFKGKIMPLGYFRGGILEMYEGDLLEQKQIVVEAEDELVLMKL
ncbi:MAG: hypothetical protein PHI01_03285 [Candidatus Izemoplasmatales bacterium]|nr:hypothetical protein [Candidatus Izemoplasmatales bacterium]